MAAGINDSALPGGEPGPVDDGLLRVADDLASLAATAQNHNARLVVVGPSWVDEARTGNYEGHQFTVARALTLRDTIRSWCSANRVDFIDMWEPLDRRPDLLSDGLHPTPEGHRELYRHLRAVNR